LQLVSQKRQLQNRLALAIDEVLRTSGQFSGAKRNARLATAAKRSEQKRD
jgi:hypothetical protein